MKSVVFSTLVLLFSKLSFAAPLPVLFEQLKDTAAHYQIVGMVCEKVAVIELEKTYPSSEYEIVNGIVYGNDNRTIGELDVVIFHRATGLAVLVGEVKCWKSLEGARAKALDQRSRFQTNLGRKINLYDGKGRTYSKKQFRQVQQFVSIAQQGATDYGFDLELENSLTELMELRQMLMTCQAQGQCARPE